MGEQQDGGKPAQVTTIVCPHCNGMIEMGAGYRGRGAPAQHAGERAEQGSENDGTGAGNGVEQWLVGMIGRGVTRVIGERGTVPQWIIIGGMLVLALLLVGLMLVGGTRPAAAPEPVSANATTPEEGPVHGVQTAVPSGVMAAAAPGAAAGAEEEAIIAMLRAYNAAETEAAETLEFAVIEPFLDPDGTFYAERHTEMQERIIAFKPHATVMQEWSLGSITIRDNEASVVTQEVWSNQEVGAVEPVIARVRVSYDLRFDAAQERWVIVSSSYNEV